MSDPATQLAEFIRGILPADHVNRLVGEDERAEWRAKYWSDPVVWARDHIRWPKNRRLAPYQEDILNDLIKHKREVAYGPRGYGKTTLASLAVLWFWSTRDGVSDWTIFTTAGGYRQLEKYLWPEIHKWARQIRWDKLGRRPLNRRDQLMQMSLRGETGEAFSAASTDPSLIEGAHASQMLFIMDESKAIPDGVFDSIEGMLTQAGVDDNEAYILAISTPGAPVGRFYEIASGKPGFEEWAVRHVEITEAIKAGRISEDWAKNRARQWGINSTLFQTHVLGKFASAAADGVIPPFWVEDAQSRAISEAAGPEDGSKSVVIAVDPAKGGLNESVIVVRRGWAIVDMIAWQCVDTMEIVQRVVGQARLHKVGSIIVDSVGVGAGVFDRLRELNLPAVAFHGGETAPDKDSTGEIEFADRRSWAWWHMRELLHPYGGFKISLPEDRKLLTDLTVATYTKVGDRLKVEKKDDIERKMRKLNPSSTDSCSPDRGDAVVMAFSDACNSNYEDAYACHTNASLAGSEREEERRERLENARSEAVQIEDLLWRGAEESIGKRRIT